MSGIDARLDAPRHRPWTPTHAGRHPFRDRREPRPVLPSRRFDAFFAAFWSGYLALLAGATWWLLS